MIDLAPGATQKLVMSLDPDVVLALTAANGNCMLIIMLLLRGTYT